MTQTTIQFGICPAWEPSTTWPKKYDFANAGHDQDELIVEGPLSAVPSPIADFNMFVFLKTKNGGSSHTVRNYRGCVRL